MLKNISLIYFILLILSNLRKKSFESLGEIIGKSGDTIRRLLPTIEDSSLLLIKIANKIFENNDELILPIDTTLIKKEYSKLIEGTEYWYDCRLKKGILSYKLQIASLTNGKFIIPIKAEFVSSKKYAVSINKDNTETNVAKRLIDYVIENFKNKKITITGDGAYASIELINHCLSKNVNLVARMPKNRKVLYKGKYSKIEDIKELKITSNRPTRTIRKVLWHGFELDITARIRINKKGKEQVIYILSISKFSSKIRPSSIYNFFNYRWKEETVHRSAKQTFGIDTCFSINKNVQISHIYASLVSYSLCQLHRKIKRLTNPEEARDLLKHKKLSFLIKYFIQILRLDQIFVD